MFDVIKRAIVATFSFISSALGATLGVFLYPLASLIRLMLSFFTYSLNIAVTIPILAVSAGFFLSTYFDVSLLNSTVGSFFVAGALTGLAMGILPLLLTIAAVRTLITSPLQVLKVGWNFGLITLLVNSFGLLRGQSERLPIAPGVNLLLPPQELFGIDGVDYNTLLQQLGEHAVEASRRPMTEEQFNACALSPIELHAIQDSRAALITPVEMRQLEADGGAAAKLVEYKNLKERLETDHCSFLQDRPERDDTVLLVKQYKMGAQWFPVPGVASIFDKTALKTWLVGTNDLRGNAIHPLTRDEILAPTPYRKDHIDHETRYVFHPYYVASEDDQPGVSQELNELTHFLRNRLQYLPAVANEFDHDVEHHAVFGMH